MFARGFEWWVLKLIPKIQNCYLMQLLY
ncbi:MAG: hypothetical protein ACLS3V_07135 [Streptococcus sp.]